MTALSPVEQSLLEAAQKIAPEITAAAVQIDRESRVPDHIITALQQAGLFAILLPRSVGGAEASLAAFFAIIEEVAKADASTAFILAHASGASTIASVLPEETARMIFGTPGANAANGPGNGGTAVRVEGGFRLTGRWYFASGSHHATWLGGGCALVGEDGRPLLRADGTRDEYFLLFPAGDAELLDTWDVSGLRGTWSDAISVKDLFVPAERAVTAVWPAPREHGPAYVFPYQLIYSIGFAAVGLGLARSALDVFAGMAGTRTSRGRRGTWRDDAVLQSQFGRAEAALRSARAFVLEAIRDAWDAACRERNVPLERRVALRLADTNAMQVSAQVVDTVYHATGGAAVLTADPLGRRFRDAHALTQQLQGRQDHYETAGRFFLGLAPDDQFL